jgi:aryl-alcohol dehydrogenase-like predicted oxidoreductase
MDYRTLGETDLKISVIAFGAWAAGGWMWGGNDSRDAIRAIRAAYDKGVTSIDTAPIYGQGASEEIVGKAIKDLPRSKVQLLTKFGMRWDLAKGDFAFHSKNNNGREIDIYKYAGRESIKKEVEDSLRRLGTEYIDLYQIHWPEFTTPIQQTFETVAELIKEGKVLHAGVCNYNVAQMKEAEKYVKLVSNQVPYSMVNRGIETEIVPYCIKNKKSILAYSPLERGLLTGKMKPGQKFEEGDHRASNPYFTDESISKTNSFLKKISPLAEEKGASLAQLVLKWTIEQPGITIALAGARNEKQSLENAGSAVLQLSVEEMGFINSELEKIS